MIADAAKAGIKVITFDAPAPSSSALTYIGTDNQTAGFEAGKKMAELMKGQGKLAILQGGLTATNLNLRTQGFKEALARLAPDVKVVDVVLIGACIMGVIKNGLVLIKVSSYWQTAIIGVVIVLAVILDRARRRG